MLQFLGLYSGSDIAQKLNPINKCPELQGRVRAKSLHSNLELLEVVVNDDIGSSVGSSDCRVAFKLAAQAGSQ